MANIDFQQSPASGGDQTARMKSPVDGAIDFKELPLAAQVGAAPHLADAISPLSPFERGAFGWAGKGEPGAQKKYLEEKFGRDNVGFQKMDDDNSGFVVKGKDDKWHQVDPHGLTDIPNELVSSKFPYLHPMKALGTLNSVVQNPGGMVGGAYQFAGEHGFDSTGAMLTGGLAAAAAGEATGNPLAAGAAGILGGAIGGAGGGLAEAGVRKALSSIEELSGEKIVGANSYNSPGDLAQQIMGSMLFGGAQELATPFLKAGMKAVGTGASRIFGSVLKQLGDTPEAKQSQAMIIKGLSGMKDGFARAWADDPDGVGNYIPQAIKDRTNNTDNVTISQKQKMGAFFDDAQSAMRGLGRQYDVIEKQAADHKFNALEPDKTGSNPVMDAYTRLQDEKFIDGKGQVIPSGTNEITRDTTGTNGQALKKMTDDFGVLLSRGGEASYKDLRIMEKNIEGKLFGENQVTDGTLRSIMGQMRSAINTVQSKGLHEVNPDLSNQLATLNQKYGPAKELLGTLGEKTEDKRLDTFLKQVVRDDGSYNAEMMNSVGNLLGIDNPTKDILHMEVAKQSVPWFNGSGSTSIAGFKLPASPGLTRQFVNGVVSPVQDVQSGITEAFAPALKKMHQVYQSLPETEMANLVKSPEAISTLQKLIAGSVVSEQDNKSKILQDSGAFQKSQFGQ